MRTRHVALIPHTSSANAPALYPNLLPSPLQPSTDSAGLLNSAYSAAAAVEAHRCPSTWHPLRFLPLD